MQNTHLLKRAPTGTAIGPGDVATIVNTTELATGGLVCLLGGRCLVGGVASRYKGSVIRKRLVE